MNKRDLQNLKYGLSLGVLICGYQLYQIVQYLPDYSTPLSNQALTQSPLAENPNVDDAQRRGIASIPQFPGASAPSSQRHPKMKFANKLDHNWKEKLIEQLKHGQSIQTIVEVSHLDSIVDQKKGRNYLMEHVKISTTLPNGNHYSYHAMVNSQTGEIASTWNYQKSEVHPMRLKARAFNRE